DLPEVLVHPETGTGPCILAKGLIILNRRAGGILRYLIQIHRIELIEVSAGHLDIGRKTGRTPLHRCVAPVKGKIIPDVLPEHLINFVARPVPVILKVEEPAMSVTLDIGRPCPYSPAAGRINLSGNDRIKAFTNGKVITAIPKKEPSSVGFFTIRRDNNT